MISVFFFVSLNDFFICLNCILLIIVGSTKQSIIVGEDCVPPAKREILTSWQQTHIVAYLIIYE